MHFALCLLVLLLQLPAQWALSVPAGDLHLKLAGVKIPLFVWQNTVKLDSTGELATLASATTGTKCQQATAAVLMLVHQGVAHAALWKEWEQLHNGSVVIWVHNKASSQLVPGVPGRRFIKQRLLTTSVDAGWGDLPAVSATIQSFGEITGRCSNVQHIAIVSGKDIPLQLLSKHNMPAQGSSFISEFPSDNTAKWQSLVRSKSRLPETYVAGLAFHHNWAIYSRAAAAALVSHHQETLEMADQLLALKKDADFRIDMDETVPLTMLHYLGHSSSIKSVGVTATHYPNGEFCAPHPITWPDLDTEFDTTFYSRPMSLRKLLQVHQRAQKRQRSTFLFLRKVHVQHAAEAAAMLRVLREMWGSN
jgi:hypothetical protein